MARRGRDRPPRFTLERQPDGLPKNGLFAEPIRVTRVSALAPERLNDGHRVTFLVEIKDAEEKRCSDVSVEARVSGPERASKAFGTTDLMGRIRFRMAGPPGAYAIHLLDVGARGLAWDADSGPRDASVTVADAS